MTFCDYSAMIVTASGHRRSLRDLRAVLRARTAASAPVTGRVGSLQPIGQPIIQSEKLELEVRSSSA